MSATSEFYLARAEECALNAENSPLENVRNRYRESQAAWLAMAEKIERSEDMRATLDAEKSAMQLASR
jgi:hypothetical protein